MNIAPPMTRPAQAAPRAVQEFYLVDRGPSAINVHLVATELRGETDGSAAGGRLIYQTGPRQDVFEVLARLCASGLRDDVTLVCDAAAVEACRRAASLLRARRVILPATQPSLVLRLSADGARRLRCASLQA